MILGFVSFSAVPDKPTNLKVTDIGKDFVSVEWSEPKFDGGSKLTSYVLLIREDGTDKWVQVKSITAFDTEFTYRKLSDSKKYFFAVAAENKIGRGEQAETKEASKPKKPASETTRRLYFSLFLLASIGQLEKKGDYFIKK